MDEVMTWKAGECGGSVVSETPCAACHQDGKTGHADTAYYGGYLVAESVPPELIPMITAAPDMLEALKAAGNALLHVECDCRDNLEWTCFKCAALKKINTARAKATGQPQCAPTSG